MSGRKIINGLREAIAMTDTPMPAPETAELEKLLAKANELLAASTELAELASYAEIVGGIHVNRPHIRKWCDRVFEIRKTLPEDENYEPAFPAADLIRLRAEVATLTASEEGARMMLATVIGERDAARAEVATLRASETRMREALTLAANRLHRCSVDYDTGTHEFIETGEWASAARAALQGEPK